MNWALVLALVAVAISLAVVLKVATSGGMTHGKRRDDGMGGHMSSSDGGSDCGASDAGGCDGGGGGGD